MTAMNPSMEEQLAKLHAFWFAPQGDEEAPQMDKRWFISTPEFDSELGNFFGNLPNEVATLELAAFAAAERLWVAAIIALDQLPRNLYRGSGQAFAFDAKALQLSRKFIATNQLTQLRLAEQLFVLMPYQHVEDLALQQEGLTLFTQFAADNAATLGEMATKTLESVAQHVAIIEQFGRFPHRNAALERTSTPAELAYLEGGGARFGQ